MDKKGLSRRSFLGKSVAALAGIAAIPSFMSSCNQTDAEKVKTAKSSDGKPNSDFGGVHMGAISYSWRSLPSKVDNIIDYCKRANVSNLELMGDALELDLGAPESPVMGIYMEAFMNMTEEERRNSAVGGIFRPKLKPEKQAIIDEYQKNMRDFRLGLDFDKVANARQRFNDAGIDIHIVKMAPSEMVTDEERDYAFRIAKAMGAKGVTDEINLELAQQMAPFAEKHEMYYCMHNHMQYATEGFSCDPILEVSPNIMLNFDFGHYYGSTGRSPMEFITKYHNRIFSMHCKDKTGPSAAEPNANQVWGQGQTPIEEVFRLIQENSWPIYCDVELEYDVKPWSDPVKEVGTCIKYARQILES